MPQHIFRFHISTLIVSCRGRWALEPFMLGPEAMESAEYGVLRHLRAQHFGQNTWCYYTTQCYIILYFLVVCYVVLYDILHIIFTLYYIVFYIMFHETYYVVL